jgi:hypothetical protein
MRIHQFPWIAKRLSLCSIFLPQHPIAQMPVLPCLFGNEPRLLRVGNAIPTNKG